MTYQSSIIITGGTQGLGYFTALNIAQAHPEALVVVASRSDATHAADAINQRLGQANTVFLALDLADAADVRRFAADWSADPSKPPIRALVLNAALQFPGALTLTGDGMEKTFAISHAGHAALFHLLGPRLAPGARVVLVSSGTHDPAQKSGMPEPAYGSAAALAHPASQEVVDMPGRQRYTTAKLCNVLWAYALARRLEASAPERRITVTALDPGLMPGTGLAREAGPVMRWVWNVVLPRLVGLLRVLYHPNVHTPDESALALSRLAVGADVEGVTGRYFEAFREIRSSEASYDQRLQDDLWDWTVDYVARGDPAEVERLNSLK